MMAIVDGVEREFWAALEYRICREVRGFEDPDLRVMWCDGLIPEQYDLRAAEPRITGRVYFGASGQQPWRFALLIGHGCLTRAQIDWASLLPVEGVTGWLTPLRLEQRLIINPVAARPDSA